MASYSSLLDQSIQEVPIAYKTWGKLNATKDNVMIICHAFTGSADVEDWWGPLMGRGKAFDPNRFFIICLNTLGSPYGSASPVTINPDTGNRIIHKLVLDHLGVRAVAVVIGGSMGGMAVLEWPLCSPPGYVRRIIPLATSARHSAWCISWGEAQRQSIYSDPGYEDGYYTSQPASGLAAARMSALLTYRSRDSFESRFGRKPQLNPNPKVVTLTPPASPKLTSSADDAVAVHNDGLRNPKPRSESSTGRATPEGVTSPTHSKPPIFSAQSYLRYQGDKFIARFDANCYIHITRKLDTHDIARGRITDADTDEIAALARVLSTLPHRALVISITTDGLFTTSEQREIAEHIPQAELVVIPSPDGHDGFLLEFEQINTHILRYLKREFSEYYEREDEQVEDDFAIKKTSVFGEAEVDITRW
ncbi:Alpha/Beta hydrolase protein [Gymnopilus junonius]|uniref:Alpha/Beta hydrolase protein n=1 Tax=Gymnopilus junonius TaxID=109634 RepID=A0A9P5NFS9_GYMJU|nr:Alpha/Beta hydrolase protein [Gymnopilus junonius]